MDNSVKIHFRDLADVSPEDGQPYIHIHGFLGLEIHGRLVPYMGYGGPNDACFNDWIAVFVELKETVIENLEDHVMYDECEQGQPAFFFEIEDDGAVISLSIIQSATGEGTDDPEWQQIRFSYSAFDLALENFRDHFMEWIRQRAPESYIHWSIIWDLVN
jgi:hypothetical protein